MTRNISRFFWLVVFGICLAGLPAWAAPPSPPYGVYDGAPFSPTVTVLQSDTVIRLELSMDHLPQGGTVDLSQRPQGLWGEMNPTGSRLPRFTIYVALPGTGRPTVMADEWTDTTFQATPRFLLDNLSQPAHVSLGNVGILGGVRVVPVNVWPIYYTNNASFGTILRHAVVQIALDSTQGENPVTSPRMAFSRPWQRLFQTLVTNWEYIPNISTSEASHILMIVPDVAPNNYLPSIAEFVRWKEQRGIKVTVVGKSSIGTSPTAQMVRNRISSEVAASSPRIDYVILVGDETKLPVQITTTEDPTTIFSNASDPGSYTNEMYFGGFDGTDVFPDVFIGRWAVSSGQEAAKVAGRSVLHERDTFLADSSRFRKAIMSADDQAESQRLTKSRIRNMLMQNGGFTQVDTMWGHNNAQNMISRINQGRSFINYRGQGWDFGWWGIDFFVQHIADLTNVRTLPVVTSIGCGTGMFNGQDNTGFGEVFMLAGTINDPKGCVGFIGPCWNTHTVFNDNLDSLIYRGWFDYGNLNLSPGLAAGKMMAWAMFSGYLSNGPVFEVTKTMMRQYHVLSDPSLQIFTRMPVRLQVSMPDSVLMGEPTLIPIAIANMDSVPAESLNVTVWLNDSTFFTRYVAQGTASIDFPVIADTTDTVMVTITGDNVLAFQQQMRRGTPPPPNAAEHDGIVPQTLELKQNYPNPFNPETALEFALPKAGYARLEIFDVLGRRVATLADGNMGAGSHRLIWNGRMEGGAAAGSGVYFCRLTTPGTALSRKMLLLR